MFLFLSRVRFTHSLQLSVSFLIHPALLVKFYLWSSCLPLWNLSESVNIRHPMSLCQCVFPHLSVPLSVCLLLRFSALASYVSVSVSLSLCHLFSWSLYCPLFLLMSLSFSLCLCFSLSLSLCLPICLNSPTLSSPSCLCL